MLKNSALFFMLVILAGCSVEKRLARLLEKHPLPADTVVVVKDTTIYRDTTIFRTIYGDTIRDSVLVPVEIDLPEMALKKSLPLAEATAWVRDNHLGLELIQYDSVFEFKLDSAIQMNKDTVIVEIVREVPVEIKTGLFWKHGFLTVVGLILLGLILWILLRR